MGWHGPPTHRQLAVWDWWLLQEWNRPSRSDHYLMGIAAEVRSVAGMFSKNAPSVRLSDFRIPFSLNGEDETSTLTAEEFSNLAKAKAIGISMAGGKTDIRRVQVTREEADANVQKILHGIYGDEA